MEDQLIDKSVLESPFIFLEKASINESATHASISAPASTTSLPNKELKRTRST